VLDLVLRNCRLPTRAEPADLAIADGRIVALGPAGIARETIDVAGRLVTPGLVEAHIHLDKALLADRVSGSAETAAEAIRLIGLAKRGFTVDDIAARARRVLDARSSCSPSIFVSTRACSDETEARAVYAKYVGI